MCSWHNRSRARALPTPSKVAYSHKAISSLGSIVLCPGPPSTARICAYTGERSSSSTNDQISRTGRSSGTISSKLLGRKAICSRLGRFSRGLPPDGSFSFGSASGGIGNNVLSIDDLSLIDTRAPHGLVPLPRLPHKTHLEEGSDIHSHARRGGRVRVVPRCSRDAARGGHQAIACQDPRNSTASPRRSSSVHATSGTPSRRR